jgi:hypothetical protein
MRATYALGGATGSGALLAKPPAAALGPARSSRPLSSFTPDNLRAMLAGDRRATRSFVELLFHGAVIPAAP